MNILNKAYLPCGFKAAAVASGIKKSGKLDLGLIISEVPAKASCVFTANKIKAAPLKIDKEHLSKSKFFQAIIVNSGNANCFTSGQGIKDASRMAAMVAEPLGLLKEAVLVASTGIIGKRMPMENVSRGIIKLFPLLSASGIDKAKKAILTTDTFAKEITVRFKIGSKVVTICGIAKGAGMISPSMATMLCFVLTDASITQRALDKSLKGAVESSFNSITVDGCMSTNDSVMVLANSLAGNKLIDKGAAFGIFTKALNTVCLELAKLIVRDGEGATKFIRINVNGAKSYGQARKGALAIANSDLFKTAIYGQNPNFGRIVASLGASGILLNEDKIRIKASSLAKKDINIDVYLGAGKYSATVYTSDLTPEYIKINAEYN
ncbi:MAG: bifunctional glutamate N-acetyltransferase/amino-acid acetyltransferase ArgJ [Candidatus Omnitrophota bacterium]|jgi:glutamate N-acetyltransferase/amino-acid N-acetyltransferase|nr:MAG: bifunctional glutamate N-acetyltransferase/amino-acid acetyltransferase ArgJ [Candidatus Omnitrophota bacterium]